MISGLAAHGLTDDSTVVDLGSGTGQFALERIAGMLRRGGVLRLCDLIYDFHPSQAKEVFERWLDGAAADPASGYTRDDYIEHIRTEHSTYRWLLEPMPATAGFEIVAVKFQGPVYGAYTCVKR
ncbi:hypothetical protein [Thermoactinospora rubra]|uniref:hypothetical protein n=1 Tax=Thermoactinospora rubra TaxID=1088767 RepID=UPI000A106D5B|nr:hypothetical protein [Thermoactinospora rubra]